MASQNDIVYWQKYRNDWVRMGKEFFRLKFDDEQEEIIKAVQTERRVSVRSGNARGKDFVGAFVSLAFLLTYAPSVIINTAPTERQVINIMMVEIKKIMAKAIVPLKYMLNVTTTKIDVYGRPDWYLLGFKARDKSPEAWQGYHVAPNIMVVATEASGLDDSTFDSIDSVLTGDVAKLLICFNPNTTKGESYKSTRSKHYRAFKLNCLNAPNVKTKQILIPGQVNYWWVKDKIERWCKEITEEEFGKDVHDFVFLKKRYRPNDLFLVKVMGEFPRVSEDQLIPLSWFEAAVERWKDRSGPEWKNPRIGCDIAGSGRNMTVLTPRIGNYVFMPHVYSKAKHMTTVGNIIALIHKSGSAYVDSTGEGAGVYDRGREQSHNFVSVKFAEKSNNKHDHSGQESFVNMRDYCFWAIRDALNPEYHDEDELLALPDVDELMEELTEIRWARRSDGKIKIEPKEELQKGDRLGRSPDYADSLALSYYPKSPSQYRIKAGAAR